MNIELFRRIIETNSIYPNEHELWIFLFNYMKKLWFNVKKQYIDSDYCEDKNDASRFNIIAEKWKWDKSLLFYAHMDTVPVHDEKLWKTDPLKLNIDNNIMYWLWTVDMKWWLFCILEAIKDIYFSWYKLKVVFWVDEESWSKWAYSLVKTDFLDDVELAIVPELWDTESIEKWCQNILLWRRWRFLIELDVPWKSCHWANASALWINAITQASIIAKEIDDNYQISKKHEFMPSWNQFVKYFYSTVSSLSVPDNAKLYIDRHIIPWETHESVISDINKIIDSLYNQWKLVKIWWQKVSVKYHDRPTPSSLAYEVDKNNIYMDLLLNWVLSEYKKYKFWYWLSVADENIIANNKNIITITMWPKWWNEHWANEYVETESLYKLIKIYRYIIKNFNKHI